MKLYVYVTHWHDGQAFDGGVDGNVFATKIEAEQAMAADKAQAIEMISYAYGGYYDEDEDGYTLVGDSDEYQFDWWEGKIIEKEI